MGVIRLETYIRANEQRCFDLSRSVDLHLLSSAKTKERAIAGKTTGLVEVGDTVTWEAVHIGIRQRLTVRITDMTKPVYFRDEMVKGAFRSMYHEHIFEKQGEGTLMKDIFVYTVPFGIFGKIFDNLFLKTYMTRFLEERNNIIRQTAESDSSIL